jgi:hypothetical protein
MSYLSYLCSLTYSGIQHILCCVLGLFFFDFCAICCQFLWIARGLYWPIFCIVFFPCFLVTKNVKTHIGQHKKLNI